MKTGGEIRTSKIDAIPEPLLPNQFDVCLSLLVELLREFHLLCVFITRAQQVGNPDRTLDVLHKDPLVIGNKSVYLALTIRIVDTRECNHEFGEYGKSMG